MATPSLKQTINTIYADADGDALMNDKDISNVRDSHAKMATSLEQTRKEVCNIHVHVDIVVILLMVVLLYSSETCWR